MKVETDIKAGGYLDQAQDQAEQFFDKADQFLQDAGQQIDRATTALAAKASRTWNCIQRA